MPAARASSCRWIERCDIRSIPDEYLPFAAIDLDSPVDRDMLAHPGPPGADARGGDKHPHSRDHKDLVAARGCFGVLLDNTFMMDQFSVGTIRVVWPGEKTFAQHLEDSRGGAYKCEHDDKDHDCDLFLANEDHGSKVAHVPL